MKLQLHRKRITRSTGGDLLILMLLAFGGIFMALPMAFAVSNAFKPLNELFLFPPQFFVRHPTLDNFHDLFVLMSDSWVPFSRYVFNTVFITLAGTAGHVVVASMGAYVLAKHKFPGSEPFFKIVILSLMFAPQITAIPNYVTMSLLGWIDSHKSVIIPAWAASLGLFLMKQFIEQMVPDSILESARIDGASEWHIFWRMVMPIVKPAWLTLIILSFQGLWGATGGNFIYSEVLRTLPFALSLITAGAPIARAGVGAAVALIMMVIPIGVFVFNQSKVVQTMGTSGLKE
ncbi:MAG: L-arabinose transport system permease protein AraQ [Syntrophomonadaceae bacterium]|nr:L-arabinose transport system permease protein AraQ [Bacillota bacterium]